MVDRWVIPSPRPMSLGPMLDTAERSAVAPVLSACLVAFALPLAAQDEDASSQGEEAPAASQEQTGDDRARDGAPDARHSTDNDEPFELFPDEEPDLSDDELRAAGDDPCELNEEGNWIDWLNRTVTRSVCGSARWFDSFFATQREWEQRDSTFGRLGLGAFWDEDDGIDPEFRFRAKFNLPNMNHRWQAAIGRGSVEEVLDGEESGSPADEFFDDESEWLVGFGYNIQFGNRARLTPAIGASFSSGVDPYVRIRYLYQQPFNEQRTQFRLRIVPQWQESKGYGYQFKPSIDHMLGEKFMVRFDVSIRDFEERFEGYAYGVYLNLFQKINRKNAMRYRLGAWSQSRLEHQPQDWGPAIQWRTTVYKEILIIETSLGATFRRRPGESEREAELLAGLVFEIKFGR